MREMACQVFFCGNNVFFYYDLALTFVIMYFSYYYSALTFVDNLDIGEGDE